MFEWIDHEQLRGHRRQRSVHEDLEDRYLTLSFRLLEHGQATRQLVNGGAIVLQLQQDHQQGLHRVRPQLHLRFVEPLLHEPLARHLAIHAPQLRDVLRAKCPELCRR